ncbi:MAG: hypothetical protein SCALA702_37160 [Melioribacteraceae bacterium]|nr:MAG: hypothetical protein SCALA702_37160 [Melioribacteraceae bacterium]
MIFTPKSVFTFIFIIIILFVSACENATPPEFGSKKNRDYNWEVVTLSAENNPDLTFYFSNPFVVDKNKIYMGYQISRGAAGIGFFDGNTFNREFEDSFFSRCQPLRFNDRLLLISESGALYSYLSGETPQLLYKPERGVTFFYGHEYYNESLFLLSTQYNSTGVKIMKSSGNSIETVYQNPNVSGSIGSFAVKDDKNIYFTFNPEWSASNQFALYHINNGISEITWYEEPLSLFKMNNEIYMHDKLASIYKISDSSVHKIKTIPHPAHNIGSIRGRSENDMILFAIDRLLHYNGINTKTIYSFNNLVTINFLEVYDDWILCTYFDSQDKKFKILRGFLE